MAYSPHAAVFTLEDIYSSARNILEGAPVGILTHRLLREVIRVPSDDPDLVQTKKAADDCKWVRQVKGAQLPDSSWGRFHTQDTQVNTAFRTTEEAIDRAFALGIDPNSQVLSQVRQYILDVLHGDIHITDRVENHESWPLLIRFILAGRLAQVNPTNKELEPFWSYLTDVAKQAFLSGNYRLEDEVAAYQQRSGIHVQNGFLESQHALWILASHRLPEQLDRAIVHWIWHKPDGIRYIRVPMANPPTRRIGYWLRSMNILTRFNSWREISINVLNRIWEQRDKDSLWDFGSRITSCVEFPLSDSWRQVRNRRLDYSTSILILLRKFYD
jgi:hypothetical protein